MGRSFQASELWPQIALGDVGSTNVEVLQRYAAGQAAPFWVTAKRQIAGRGRRGRTWISEPGNLYASCLFEANQPHLRMSELPFVAALTLHRAVAGFLGRSRTALTLKWPNDLLYDGAKIAGILIEAQARPGGSRLIVVGFGVNCRTHPSNTPYRATDLAAEGFHIDPDRLFEQLNGEFAASIADWQRPDGGFEELREAWLTVASGLGAPIQARLDGETLEGRFETIDCTGALILALPNGTRRVISAADIFPGTKGRRAEGE